MGRPGDVIIGLDVGTREVRGAAFAPGGVELGAAVRPLRLLRPEPDAVEVDPVQVWHAAVRVVHQLADRVPDLGRRTVALGLAGAPGGLCLIDEDGDPLPPACSPLDRRPGAGPDGCLAGPGGTAAGLDRLIARAQPELERAASALDLTGWVHVCLTGEPARDPAQEASAAPRTPLAQVEHERLLPARLPLTRALPLGAAASAATGLWEGTPVILAPPAPIAAAIASGIFEPGFSGGVSVLDDQAWHVRSAGDAGGSGTVLDLGPGLVPLRLTGGEVGADALEWLYGFAESLFAAAGLIGLSRPDLRQLLDEKAAAAPATACRFTSLPGTAAGGWMLHGLTGESEIGSVVRAIHEGMGFAARHAFGGGDGAAGEVRLAAGAALGPALRGTFPDCAAAPVRALLRPAPAAAGAALAAALAIGQVPDLGAGAALWIEPFLGPAEVPDPALAERHAEAFRRWRGS